MNPPHSSKPRFRVLIFGAALGAFASLFVFGYCPEIFERFSGEPQKRPLHTLLDTERNTVEIFDEVSASVVNIESKKREDNPFSMKVRQVPSGSGSGFVWDSAGHVVTNYHVVEDSREVVVTLSDQRRLTATVVGVDPSKDIAVLYLRLGGTELTPVRLGDDSAIRVGQKVLAIGNPFGLDHTLSTGIVSALDRELETRSGRTIEGVIQTDAAINPGNSGGPLLDSQGEVIGMNTGIVTLTGTSVGVGFAIPVSTIARVVPDLIAYGKVRKAQLGLRFLSERVSVRAGLRGLVVGRVVVDSEAQKSGIRGMKRRESGLAWIGDVVVAADGAEVLNRNDLLNVLDRKEVGDSVLLTISRDGDVIDISVLLEAER